MKRSILAACVAGVTTLAAGVILVAAGPLNPPGGAVASSYKTLTEVEPRIAIGSTTTPGNATCVYRLNQAGSYYLTGNVTVPSGKSGIVVGTYPITIDLNGYSIIGTPGSLAGITASGNFFPECTVRNGTIRDCGGNGVDLTGCWSSRVTDVNVDSNGGNGIVVVDEAIVRGCVAYSNGQAGFTSTSHSSFIDCISTFNTIGFKLDYVNTIVQGCNATGNSGDGFVISGAIVTNSQAYANAGAGFNGSYGDRLSGCISENNTGAGFVALNACVVCGCTSVQNHGIGFNLGSTATIRDSVAQSNLLQGIKVVDQSTIEGNQVRSNGGGFNYAGIWCAGNQCVVQGNQSIANGYGMFLSGTNSLVVRNICGQSLSSNYSIVAGNRVGLVTAGATNAAINGNSGGGMGFTDPNANVAY